MRIVAYIGHPCPDHTTPFCWLSLLGRMGAEIFLLYERAWQKVRFNPSPLYPIKLVDSKEDGVDLIYDWAVFLLTAIEPGEMLRRKVENLYPPQRGAILLGESEKGLGMWESTLVGVASGGGDNCHIFNLSDTPKAPFITFPPDLLCGILSRKKWGNKVLVTRAHLYDPHTHWEYFVNLCDQLEGVGFAPYILHYDDGGPCPPTVSPVGLSSYVATYPFWINVSLHPASILSSGLFEYHLARAGGTTLVTNLSTPPYLDASPYIRKVEHTNIDAIREALKEQPSLPSFTLQDAIQEVKEGWKLISTLLGLGGEQ